MLEAVPDCFKTREVCDKAMRKSPSSLMYVPDWFVTQQQIKMWHDDDEYCDDDDELIEWCNGYKNQKAQKAKIKDELMPVAWHPSQWWKWCMPEDNKKRDRKIVKVIC